MTRAVALSNPAVIEELNEHFVSIEINLSKQKFPAEFDGLAIWKKAYERDSRYAVGFSTSVVLGPQGVAPYGTSGCGHQGELGTAINYDADRFLTYLKESRDRYQRRAKAVLKKDQITANEIEMEAMAQLRQANICKCKIKKEIFPSDPPNLSTNPKS